MTAILEITNLSKSFPGVQALQGVDYDLHAGEIHCLVGENGAGKSTFIKILSGAISPDSGTIRIFGQEHVTLTPHLAIELGIQTVYQESILVGTLSVAENIYLGHERVGRLRQFDKRATIRDASALLDSLNITIDPRAVVETLSTAERQIVGIVKALSKDARILILDEPTASLSGRETQMLLELLREIVRKEVGIIYISHHLEEVFEIGDRITVLKDGRKVSTHGGLIDQGELIREMVGRSADLFYTREEVQPAGPERHVLEIRDYSRGRVVRNVSFRVESGEIFGIGGMVGSGRTELVRMLFGLDRRDSGRLVYDGRDITPETPLQAIRRGICLITEDRQKTGLILVRSVKENIASAKLNATPGVLLDLKAEEREIRALVRQLRVMTPSIEQEVRNLSGGNQQKVVLAKWLLTNADVFLFDEPTRGIDIGAKEEIYRLMTDLARQNKIIIMVSSDMPELTAMSDRIGVMRDGGLTAVLSKGEISEESVLSHSIGVH
ncbi:MAG: sugar ABC transporter ATP-binding protein [Spirochaetales bacterium]|nr:sugar ABC transporter ATP-binding protein [Spirochaetales bacterium]